MNIDTTPANRAARRAQSGGRHRQTVARQGTVGLVVAAALAAGIALAPSASADPGQAGIGDGGGQAGITGGGGQSGLTTPAPAPAPEPERERAYWVEPPAQYSKVQWQKWDAYYDDDTSATDDSVNDGASQGPGTATETAPAAPLDVNTLHGPVPIEEPTVPIAAPAKVVKIGDFYDDQPSWLSDADLDRTNNSTAVIEAQVTDFWRSIGVPTDRAQRLSASQLAAGGAGLVTGGVAAGVPGAVVGALGGGTIGGIAGALAGGLIPIAPGIAPITTGIAGTAGGAALGAAVVGIPSAAVGAATGLGVGLALGTTYGAGDLGEPQKIELPDFPQAAPAPQPAPIVTAPAPVAPAPLPQAAPVWTEPETVVDTARGFVTSQVGGQELLDTVDRAANDAAPAIQDAVDRAANDAAPAVQALNDAVNAVINPAPAPA
ncbi:hypothetical protein [Rhodococcoides fascians]|uniref:hypothetical protein n=1 Tax=Rhodococcoides fascians TaxID=1828 RepID=UPI00068C761F|nr:hypothetical protein [Rhodococcus fascians]